MRENLSELIRYRELLRNLTLRDLKVRYRNSVLGLFWAWGNPILMTLVFTVVFSVVQKSDIQRFALFILVAWQAWSFTAAAVGEGIGSIVSGAPMVKKIYFPREVLPAAAVLANAANYLFTIPLVLLLILLYGVHVDPTLLLYFPVIFASQVAFLLGLVFFLSAVNVFYRDTGVIINVLLTAWFFLTPVVYPVRFMTGHWNGLDLGKILYYVNPMASIIQSYRSIFYGSDTGGPPGAPATDFLLRTVATALVALLLGYLFFKRVSPRFGEEV